MVNQSSPGPPTPGPTPVTLGAPLTRQVDLGRVRVSHALFPAGHRIGSHFHDRACVSVVLEGRYRQRFPGRAYDCPPGGVIAKAPAERHTDEWFDVASEHVILEPHPDRHGEFGACAPLLESVTHMLDPGARALGWRIRRELTHPDAVSGLALEALALELLVRIRRRDAASGPVEAGRPWLTRVRDYLHAHYAERVTLDALAAVAGVHPTHVSRCFRRLYGMGVATYLRELRLAAAIRDLLASDLPIARIALRHGFADQPHLTRSLKRAHGVTPGQLRGSHPSGSD